MIVFNLFIQSKIYYSTFYLSEKYVKIVPWYAFLIDQTDPKFTRNQEKFIIWVTLSKILKIITSHNLLYLYFIVFSYLFLFFYLYSFIYKKNDNVRTIFTNQSRFIIFLLFYVFDPHFCHRIVESK